MRISFLILLCCLISVGTTFAANTQKTPLRSRTHISSNTCGQVITNIEKTKDVKLLALVVGSFISGSNYAKNRNSKIPLRNMLILTERYCRKNPNKPLTAALINLDRIIDRQIKLSAVQ